MAKPNNRTHMPVSVEIGMHTFDGPVDGLAERVAEYIPEGTVNAEIETVHAWEYCEVHIKGWRPKTEKEIKAAKRRREQAQERTIRQRKDARLRELATIEKLARKHGLEVTRPE